ncbi:MAG: 3-oxoacyl-[acyl-carrier-protein] reductase [Pseudomonadales bacterium]
MSGADAVQRRVALVTGASRGIGKAIALQLQQDGFYVVGTATSAQAVGALDEALGEGGTGLLMRIEDEASVQAAFQQLEASCGMPLVVVNNAGITRDNLLLRMKAEEWDAVVHTNLGGLYRVVKPALRAMMKARWGRIVNLSSVVARMGNAGQTNYVASKAGIEGFTRSLGQELASRNITVNAVAPGFIETDMTAELTPDQVQGMLERIPLARMGSPADIAHAVSFLVSERAGYITGATLQVNGGLYMG